MSELEKEVKDLKFKLKGLSNFVYEHHHKVETEHHLYETSKPKVWVSYPDGYKEEPSD